MRRLLLTASVAVACAAFARPVDAQFTYGIQGAALTGLEVPTSGTTVAELDATYGVGGRVMFSPPIPVLSLSLVGQGVYYFPENGDYMSYGIGARFGLGLPVITPYVIGGWQWRRSGDGTNTTTENGLTAGAGVELNFAVNLFLEATVEMGEDIPAGLPDYDNSALVIQAGVLFGG
jgi:opacity protein-like surface antigen